MKAQNEDGNMIYVDTRTSSSQYTGWQRILVELPHGVHLIHVEVTLAGIDVRSFALDDLWIMSCDVISKLGNLLT